MAVALWNCVLLEMCEVQILLQIAGSCDRSVFFSWFPFGQIPGDWALFDSYPNSLLASSLTIHLPRPGLREVGHRTELITLAVNCVLQGSPDESKLQHTGTRSATTWPPHYLCYRPAVFFLHLRSHHAFSYDRKNWWRVQKIFVQFFFFILWNRVSRKLQNSWECL